MINIGLLTDFHRGSDRLSRLLERLDTQGDFNIETVDAFQGIESIPQAVLGLINLSDVLVAHFLEESSNLSYEIGLAHGLGKPVVLVGEPHVGIPGDLMGYQILSMPNNLKEEENFLFRLGAAVKDAQKRKSDHFGLRGRRLPFSDNVLSSHDFNPTRDFRSLFAFEGGARARRFEQWFAELARGVPGWEVIEPEQDQKSRRNRDFDLVLWNSLEDSELQAFGNPVAVEFKAMRSMNFSGLHEFLHRSRNSGLKAVILATTGVNDRSTKRRLARLRQQEKINAIALDRDDFLQVQNPPDLVRILKQKVRNLLYREDLDV